MKQKLRKALSVSLAAGIALGNVAGAAPMDATKEGKKTEKEFIESISDEEAKDFIDSIKDFKIGEDIFDFSKIKEDSKEKEFIESLDNEEASKIIETIKDTKVTNKTFNIDSIRDVLEEQLNVIRIAGQDRYDTALELSKYVFKGTEKTDTVIIANGEKMIDALTAGPLAKKYNAPILLTQSNTLKKELLNEIKRLDVKNVLLVGGTDSLDKTLEKDLEENYTVNRIAGSNRYRTAEEIAKTLGYSNKSYIVASGLNMADGILASGLAMKEEKAILLADKGEANLPSKAKDITIVGGAVTKEVEETLKNQNVVSSRIEGKNRIETAQKVADVINKNATSYVIANSDKPTDALTATVLAYKTGSPLLFVNDKTEKLELPKRVKKVYLIGGVDSIKEELENQLIKEINPSVEDRFIEAIKDTENNDKIIEAIKDIKFLEEIFDLSKLNEEEKLDLIKVLEEAKNDEEIIKALEKLDGLEDLFDFTEEKETPDVDLIEALKNKENDEEIIKQLKDLEIIDKAFDLSMINKENDIDLVEILKESENDEDFLNSLKDLKIIDENFDLSGLVKDPEKEEEAEKEETIENVDLEEALKNTDKDEEIINEAEDLSIIENIFDFGGLNKEEETEPTEENDKEEAPVEKTVDLIKFADDVLKYTNEIRAKHGLEPLTMNENVRGYANERAGEITEKFDHVRPNDENPLYPLIEAGYTNSGENIALDKNAEEMVKAWEQSPDHLKNILNPEFKEISIGVEYKDDMYYGVQIFTD